MAVDDQDDFAPRLLDQVSQKAIEVAPESFVAALERLGVLNEITGGKRGRTYTFESYVTLFR